MFKSNQTVAENPCVFVIFGGTGDLTKRKLIPALFSLFERKKLPKNFAIVATGRKSMSDEEYKKLMKKDLGSFIVNEQNEAVWEAFCKLFFYFIFDFSSETENYNRLKEYLDALDRDFSTEGNRIYYLAVAPAYFSTIITSLKENELLENQGSWQRVMVEKPFGTSLEMAKDLNEEILKSLAEENIFRIDHYLGKEMVQNIIVIRFCNSIFESMWNHKYIDNIQIISSEKIGVEKRGGYYENTGILKDMLQNHILQMLSLICMEAPVDLSPEAIRDEKVKVLKSLRLFDKETDQDKIILGQYGKGQTNGEDVICYRDEDKVDADSMTPTFMALKTYVDNFRWGGVPIYIRAGKRLDRRISEIIIQFKKLPGTNYYDVFSETEPNVLKIRIHPAEGIFFTINAKKPGIKMEIEKVGVDYCQIYQDSDKTVEPYEHIIIGAIQNNPSFFTRWDEIENSWNYIRSIADAVKNKKADYPNYAAGSKGPKEVENFLDVDGRKWWG